MKVGRRGNIPENRQNRCGSELRALSDVLLRNFGAQRAAFAARIFRKVPELRGAKRIPIGRASRRKAGGGITS
jgi:hypothetical protein